MIVKRAVFSQTRPGAAIPTIDLDQARRDPAGHGDSVVLGALSPEGVELLRSRILEQAQRGGAGDKLISPPVVANIMWPLDEFSIGNGATRIGPGNHLSGDQPDPKDPYDTTAVHMVGPPGSAIVFDGRHGRW